MHKHCVCLGLLVLAVGCSHDGQPHSGVGNEAATSSVSDEGTNSTRHVELKPELNGSTATGTDALQAPLQMQAIELASKELAINLRLMEEEDVAKRKQLEQEMAKLREQRQSLYQTRMEGN